MLTVQDSREDKCHAQNRATSSFAIVIPTYNASVHWKSLHEGLLQQGLAKQQVLVIDSSSTDDTQALVRKAGYSLICITKEEFGHGATRQIATRYFADLDILIYLTQDAVPHGRDSFKHLADAFLDPLVGAACGRQIARPDAGPIERHARIFNYPSVSNCRALDDRKVLGIKTAFLSNSFAAYRRSALQQVGGFPVDTIVNEDMTVAARMLLAGWKVAYQANATVIHSHPFTMKDEFSRYFDTGVYHAREKWLIDEFGSAGGEGLRFVISELKYLRAASAFLLPVAVMRTINKWIGYKMGLHERYIPLSLKRHLSSQKNFWQTS